MPRDLPKYVERFRDKTGKVRLYFRRDKQSPRFPLPENPNSDAFSAAYAAALAGVTKKAPLPGRTEPGTLGALIASYKASSEFRALRATTKAGYFSRLRILEDAHAHRSLVGMTRENIIQKILHRYAGRPGQAHALLKMLRVLVRHGIIMNQIKTDPTIGIKRPALKEVRAWTEDEIAKFEAHWPIGSKQRLAFALMLHTGQRRSDVHRMTWGDIDGQMIRVVQQKTHARLSIPLHAELRKVLAVAPSDHVAILTTRPGASFTVAGFSNFLHDAVKAAGLPDDCRPHGLRKAAGRRLAEAGCTSHEIMAILGHKSLAEAERYTRAASQELLAESAIRKAEKHRRNKTSQTTLLKFGEIAKRQGKTGC